MVRRRKSSPAEDLVDLIAMLPWWVGCVLAVVLYLLLHRIATQQVITNVAPGQIAPAMIQSIWRTLASFGQYLVPLLCLVGVAVSAYRRWRRQNLVAGLVGSKAADALDGMSWQEFERLVGEAFRLQGYQVTETGGGGADGGIDLVLRKGGEKYLVQCKQWKAFSVGMAVVRELYGVMAAKGATGGFVVTSGRFTDEAKAFASGRNVKLIDGPLLHSLIKQVTADHGVGAKAAGTQEVPFPAKAVTPPSCPVCTKPMVQRTAKRGNQTGNTFWGCSGYPACRGTRQIG
ncbi:restriction endonuclease [Polaromonas sp. C04]|uniref:restriction endonuclease n=1 Tax=Polaromonas sp. C04 TaxID=1945857 RepID=UPI0009844F2D|nr:restriction endonuclease [Polaromonas sp. C04]OOG53087.1 restriction endonuclease [Polaromonas sp. C04]